MKELFIIKVGGNVIDDEKKLFKKTEYENNNLANNLKELET